MVHNEVISILGGVLGTAVLVISLTGITTTSTSTLCLDKATLYSLYGRVHRLQG